MGLKFSNFGKAIVASAPSGTSGLAFTVEAGKGSLFPTLGTGDYFYGIFKDASGNREIVKVDARSTDSMTVAAGGRGIDGTTARTWAAGDLFVAGIPNIALQEGLVTNLSAFARTLLDDTTAAAARTTLGAAASASPALTGIPTAPSATLNTNTTQLATTGFVISQVSFSSIGHTQTWQNMTASRATNTTYTNTTGRPICVSVCLASSTNNSAAVLIVNGTFVYGSSGAAAGEFLYVSTTVPIGATYRAGVTVGTPSITADGWAELR